jgi:hypothetical protein
MNKRLKELVRQAKPSPNLIWEDAELERFADLVRQDYLRELKALNPVAYYNKKHDTAITAYELGNHVDSSDVPLYALEVTK